MTEFTKKLQSINLKTAPQRHRDTEKNNISISCRASRVRLFGEREDRGNDLFFLCVLGASVVQLLFLGSKNSFSLWGKAGMREK
jgi:hypothetical protein